LASLSVSVFHQAEYARVLALISRMVSVGGITLDSIVLRRDDMEAFMNDEVVDEDEEDATG
jgi:hypothetical protein